MSKAYFAIALHFHQPIGNFETVFESAYQNCYEPFFELLSESPDIKITLHISGCLLDYLDAKHPRILELIKDMIARGQIEMLGGAYYEPILPAIPKRDIIGQIGVMSEYLRRRFGCVPGGMWIAERVWEPELIEPIYDAGISYTILDDSHLLNAGIKKENMYGFFLTGGGDKKIAIFPSDKTLRYSIPFAHPDKILDYFRDIARKTENPLFVYGDDGEKFGEWPMTHDWVYDRGWLKNFFAALKQNNDWIELIKLSDYLKHNAPIGRAEIPQGAYEEMMQWSGGSWMNFLKKYPETGRMHKKMIYVSNKIDAIEKKANKADLEKVGLAKKELYKGQCNCGWWHGVFGGLYLFHLRKAIYEHLIRADKIADDILQGSNKHWLDIKEIDLDSNGKKQIIMENNTFSLCLDPDDAGVLKELDYRPLSFNLINTLSRKEEPYHQKILKAARKTKDDTIRTIHEDYRSVDPKFKGKMIYDKFSRCALRDYFLPADLNIDDFSNSLFEELGDFSSGRYSARKKSKGVVLEHSCKVFNTMFSLSKQVQIKSEKKIEILYIITKEAPGCGDLIFGIEFNLVMPYLNSDRYVYFGGNDKLGGLGTKGAVGDISSFGITDKEKEFGIIFNFSPRPQGLWYFPVETISQTESAYKLNYQCSCIFPRWKLNFKQNKPLNFRIDWIITR
ncbi:MAG: DUF1926 domain-containing protein [Candidatus Omnitrophica bacterium]|nr:DUF1926 domain-containing protein [Candidatus Omnitrophota bacterium]